jgi:hypothetical protein
MTRRCQATVVNLRPLGKSDLRRAVLAAPARRGGHAGFPSADRNNSTLFELFVDIDNTVEVWPVAC